MRSMIFTNFSASIQELYELESIIKITKESSLSKEFNNAYYGLSGSNQLKLSEERNGYVNLLSVALNKIEKIQKLTYEIEDNLEQL